MRAWNPIFIAGLCAASLARADVKLPALFSDHMVVQAGAEVPVWGWADPGERVTVSLAGQSLSVKTATNGRWMVRLAKLKPTGHPQTMTVTGRNALTVRDVLVGEVWLCAGQSNMVMPVSGAKDFERERAAAALPGIRMFTVGAGRAVTAQAACPGAWVVCAPESVGEFSATAFFFGRELHRSLNGAVGLINSSAGGTLIESWIDADAQRATPALAPYFAQREKLMAAFDRVAAAARHQEALMKWEAAVREAKAANQPPPRRPSDPLGSHLGAMDVGGLFNGKIAPLIPYALRGIVWYQGESNAHPDRARFYETQMRLLVRDWRARWGGELPVAWVQLPNLNKRMPWPEIREAQLKCLDLPKTGMAITIDAGESKDIHPKDKQTVGRRLAQWALGGVYGQKVAATSGPLPAGHEIRGGEIVLRFRHTDGGLVAKGGELKGFVIAGADRAWQAALARIAGDTVIVSTPSVRRPVAVRYAWAADPVCNLGNGAGLPASPFRTDDWEPATP